MWDQLRAGVGRFLMSVSVSAARVGGEEGSWVKGSWREDEDEEEDEDEDEEPLYPGLYKALYVFEPEGRDGFG